MRSAFVILIWAFLLELNAQNSLQPELVKEVITGAEVLPRDYLDSLNHADFSILWSRTSNDFVYGFIGPEFQRIKVKLLSIIKDDKDLNAYHVYGKDMVKSNICEFQGYMILTQIIRFTGQGFYGLDEAYRDSISGRFVVFGSYRLLENPNQQHTGILEGMFATYFYLTRDGALRYDNLNDVADGYRNNLFAGTWNAYVTQQTKPCNWGDYRIPFGEGMDIGAGMFSPADEYLPHGWQSYRDAYIGIPDERALAIERAEWWK